MGMLMAMTQAKQKKAKTAEKPVEKPEMSAGEEEPKARKGGRRKTK